MNTQMNSCGRYQHKTTRFCAKQMIACMVLVFISFSASSVFAQRRDTVRTLDEVIISDVRANDKTPMTTTTLGRDQLEEARIATSIPYMLELQPSVVATGENGMVGNTSMRIRGVSATGINVNINGITLNDPESQCVFWVNIPNLAGMAQSLQIQRGIGASNGGSNSFGGAINLQTLTAGNKPYANADISYGSWNTRQYGITAGTGVSKNGFGLDVAYNGFSTDGFVRGGDGSQNSLFLSGGYYGKRSILKGVAIIGQQRTGIAWNGADTATLNADPTYNSCGSYKDEFGNELYYAGEKDYYWQRHYQLFYSLLINDNWNLNAAIDFTHGDGYDGRYKENKSYFSYLGLTDSTLYGHFDTLPDINGQDSIVFRKHKTDMILEKKMENNAFTENLSLRYHNDKFSISMGETFLYYKGRHFGQVMWTANTDDKFDWDKDPYEFYSNNSTKIDATVFTKINYEFSDHSNIYADLQFRYVDHKLTGNDDDYAVLDWHETYPFFNPKVGWNYRINDNQRFYVLAGINHREPVRNDIKEASHAGDTIKAEQMLDVEMGYAFSNEKLIFHANAYAMLYKDQLTPSGKISESYYTLMTNVDKSYRIGVELEAGYRFTDWFDLSGNLTLSQNKIVDYTYEYRDPWGEFDSMIVDNKTTDLALSPNIVGAAIATFKPVKAWKLQLIGKYVGEQYADNTSREEFRLDDYFLLNFRTSYVWQFKNGTQFELQGVLNNILNHAYFTHAQAYDDYWGGYYQAHMYFRQPGVNFTLRGILKF